MKSIIEKIVVGLLLALAGASAAHALPDYCPEGRTPFLVVVDDYAASWMTINSSFTGAVKNGDRHEKGILFQLGAYDRIGADPDRLVVEIWNGDRNPIRLGPKNFSWLDVVPVKDRLNPNPARPMQKKDSCALAPGLCGDSGEDRCEVLEGVVDYPLKKCLRGRTLHREFRPVAVLTYWSGQKGYSMTAEQAPVAAGEKANHMRYAFALHDPVRVYKNGESSSVGGDLIKCIAIRGGDGDHLPVHVDHEDPPWLLP